MGKGKRVREGKPVPVKVDVPIIDDMLIVNDFDAFVGERAQKLNLWENDILVKFFKEKGFKSTQPGDLRDEGYIANIMIKKDGSREIVIAKVEHVKAYKIVHTGTLEIIEVDEEEAKEA